MDAKNDFIHFSGTSIKFSIKLAIIRKKKCKYAIQYFSLGWWEFSLKSEQLQKTEVKIPRLSWFTILGTGSGYASDFFSAWDWFPLTVPRLVFLLLILKDQEMCWLIYLLANSLCTILSRTVRNQRDLFPLVPGEWCWHDAPLSQAQDVCAVYPSVCSSENRVAVFRAVVPNLFGTRDQFCGRQLFHGPESEGWFRDYSSTVPLLCTFFSYYYYIRCILDH